MYKGFFLTIEGIDGVGKTTQLYLLLQKLKAKHSVFFTKEPGDGQFGSSVGVGIRDILFRFPGTKNLAPGVGDLLFLADHVQNVHDIRHALNQGDVVVADRYADSQFAYAADPSKKSPAWATKLYAEHYGIVPDLTILLVARGPRHMTNPPGPEDISWALDRANARRGVEVGKQDGKAWNDSEAQRKIQTAYLTGLMNKPRTLLINVWEQSTVDDIHAQIMAGIEERMQRHGEGTQPNLPLVDAFQPSEAA
jgi:dTMP kinase